MTGQGRRSEHGSRPHPVVQAVVSVQGRQADGGAGEPAVGTPCGGPAFGHRSPWGQRLDLICRHTMCGAPSPVDSSDRDSFRGRKGQGDHDLGTNRNLLFKQETHPKHQTC